MSIIIAHATRTSAMLDAIRNTPWSNGNEIYCTFCVRVLRDFAYMYQSLFLFSVLCWKAGLHGSTFFMI